MFDVFSIKEFSFPKDFLWGSATAAHQIEGDNFNSSHWAQEQENLKNNPSFEISGKAINHYEMFLQDADLLKSLHHKAYRMGVEWAKIEPEEGVFCQEVIDHYVKELSYLKELGITVLLTLVHFSTPLWFKNKGNFSSIDNLKYFERYLNKVVPIFSHYVDYWCVMNEQNLMDDLTKFNSVRFHARGYSIIKKYSSAPVSSAHALEWIYAKRQNDKFDKIYADFFDLKHNEYFFYAIRTGELIMEGIDAIYDKEIKNSCDFWAPNMYVRRMIDSRQASWHGRVERYPFVKMRMIDMDFYLEEFNPECVYQNLLRLKDKPVIITENGISCDNDEFRLVFLTEYLSAVNEAIKEGVDVKGYMHWSTMDNYEWDSFIPKFGLVDVDRENGFKRTPKPSAYFYRDIIDANGYKPEMLKKYLKEMPKL